MYAASSAGYFCVAVDEVRLTGYSCQINIYVLSYVCVLIFIVDPCILQHLPGGGQCDLDSGRTLAVTVLKVHRLSILKPWSGGRIFPYGWAGTRIVSWSGEAGSCWDELSVVHPVILAPVTSLSCPSISLLMSFK